MGNLGWAANNPDNTNIFFLTGPGAKLGPYTQNYQIYRLSGRHPYTCAEKGGASIACPQHLHERFY